MRGFAFHLLRNVEQIAGVEANFERGFIIGDFDFLNGGAIVGAAGGKRQHIGVQLQLDGSGSFGGDCRDPVDGLGEVNAIDLQKLVIADGDYFFVIREGAVDQFRR